MGQILGILSVYNWYDYLMLLNPMYLLRRLQVWKYRLLMVFDLYILLPIMQINNQLFGNKLSTPIRSWDYNLNNNTDDAIIEAQSCDLSKRLNADFLGNKHGPYVARSLDIMNKVLPSYVRGKVADKFNETAIYNYITSTTLSFSMNPDGNSLDLSIFNKVPEDSTRQHEILPAYFFKLDHENQKAYVFDDKDKPVPADTPEVAIVLSTSLLAFTHSFIHFHLPTSMALFADKLISDPNKKNSRLAQLLDKHTRFTLMFNYAGHNMFFPVQKQNWTFPYCFRITQNDFAFINISRTQHYYNLTAENQTGHYITGMPQYKDKPDFDDRFLFHRMVKPYYDLIDTYVRNFGVEEHLLQEFVAYCSKLVPTIEIKDPMTMLVTMIWQVSAMHSMDHFQIYAQRQYMAFGDPADAWNFACSQFTLETYVLPFMVPGQDEELSKTVDITGLPNWEWMCNSISF